MKSEKEFHDEFPLYVMWRLYYAMQEINSAGSFADRFWEDDEMFAKAEAKMFAEFEAFPRLKDALPKIYAKIVEKKRDGFSLDEIAHLKQNPIFKQGNNN